MPSTPTTKSQVQAYQFVLRRMQSALVRRDAVMLHDPMRTHSRATIVGVVLSAIAMLGFVIFGFFRPAPTAPESGIVVGEQSGSIYVVTSNPRKLIPTFNLASARLILMAQQQQSGEGGGQQSGAVQVADAKVVPDEQLKDIPRGRLQGIPDGPQLLPTKDQMISPRWAVCDQITLDSTLTDEEARKDAEISTTVFAGLQNYGRELGVREGLLVEAEDGRNYLIYRQQNTQAGVGNAVRAEVDLNDAAVRSALRLQPDQVRQISLGLLNAIPAVAKLTTPRIEGAGEATQGFNLDALPVGAVFQVNRTDRILHYVVLRAGVQEIPQAAAEMIRSADTQTDVVPSVHPDKLQSVPTLTQGQPGTIDLRHYPQFTPEIIDQSLRGVSCLGWSVQGEGSERNAHTAVYVESQLPGPKDGQNNAQVVGIGTPAPDNWKIDSFYLQPGFAAVVRSATTADTFGRGSIQLISDRGMRYSIPTQAIAEHLGFAPDDLQPAPESIIKLLPVGASLNPQSVMRTFDSVPVDPEAGTFEEAPQAASGGN
ncbi:type VII secretion protein EccB [Saccharomonospora sp. NPDC046836]|uniref:type VII secretion protein EccB n=1 Tax=Saccharomonospora sp. NPDC046836 TaxID=3156921 RepID=UPI0033F9F980